MARTCGVFVVLFVAGIAGGGMWLLQPAPTPFLVPSATDIQIINTGWGERQISYRAPGRPYGWYFTLVNDLAAQKWTQPDAWNPATPRHTYNHVVTLWFGYLWDQAVLSPDRGDPEHATITLRRRIVIPWWRYWPPAAQ